MVADRNKDNLFIFESMGCLKLTDEKTRHPLKVVYKRADNFLFLGQEQKQGNPKICVSDYHYRFNGQELQDELGLNWYTYRYRNYDPTYARFFGVDPISEDYYNITTYQFAHNNPVWKIEIEGLEGAKTTNSESPSPEDAGGNWSITDYAAGAWGAAGNMFMGAVTSTYSGIESGITETGKVIDAYNEGGVGAAVEQYGQSVYETSGAKGLVDTASAALSGDANAQGQAVVLLATAVITHKAGGGTKTSSSTSSANAKYSNTKQGSTGGPGAGKNFSEATKNAAEVQAGGKCVFCDVKTTRSKTPSPTRRNTDHATSKKNGGNNTLDNAQNTCQKCNLEKGSLNTDEYIKKREGGN